MRALSQSRAELFEIITATEVQLALLDCLDARCDICKPVVASILASTGLTIWMARPRWARPNDHQPTSRRTGSYQVLRRLWHITRTDLELSNPLTSHPKITLAVMDRPTMAPITAVPDLAATVDMA